MNQQTNTSKCLCGSGKLAESCCLALLQGETVAKTPEQLMRSRFMAFALRDVDYLNKTWHSSTRPESLELQLDISWYKLSVIQASQVIEGAAYVQFVAYFQQAGVEGKMHERSRFIFEQNKWFYLDGEPLDRDSNQPSQKQGRNEPCLCGSGKKYKKCCGRG